MNSSLSYYRVILGQWVSGHGLQQIISEAIRYKKNNPHEAMFIDGKKVDYKEGSEHNNIIISEVLYRLRELALMYDGKIPLMVQERASWPKKIGRNELCPCGSGKKYKFCHGKP